MIDGPNILYRIVNAYDMLYLRQYNVIKHNPKSCWVFDYQSNRKRIVYDTAAKRFAYPTIEAAMNSYYKRKRRQVVIIAAQLKIAEESLSLVDTPSKRTDMIQKLSEKGSYRVTNLEYLFE